MNLEGTSLPDMEPSQWIIGYFPKEHKYSVIPMNWLTKCGESYYCKWPNMRVSPTMLRNATSPNSKWNWTLVKVIERYDNYEDAASREVDIYLTSSGETDVGDMGQENKRKFLKTCHKPNDDNDDSSDSEEHFSVSKIKQKGGINYVSVDISTYQTKSSQLDINSAEYNKMEKTISTNNLFLDRIDKKLDIILDLLKKNQTNSVSITAVDTHFLNLFPLKELETLKHFEEKLVTDDEFKSKLVNLISAVGGTNVKHFVKRVLSKLFSNQLASHCSWTGFKNNFRLEELELMKTMKNICIDIFPNDENLFEVYVKDWFRHASQRLKRDLHNESSKKKNDN